MTLRELSEAIRQKHKEKYPNMPDHAIPKKVFSDNSANALTQSILAWFNYKGIQAFRQSSEGRYIKGKEYTDWAGRKREEKGMFIPRSKSNKGAADISATIPPYGRRLEIEVKYGKDRQSPDQKKFQEQVESMGGIYMIVRSWNGFIEQIKQYKL